MKEEAGNQGKQRHTCERVREWERSCQTRPKNPTVSTRNWPGHILGFQPPHRSILVPIWSLKTGHHTLVVIVAEIRRDRCRFKLEKPRPKPIPLPLILLEFDHVTASLLFPTTPSSIPDHLQSPGVTVSPPANCWKFTASLPHVGTHRRPY